MDSPCHPKVRSVKECKEFYISQLYTQLIISGVDSKVAMGKAKQAAETLSENSYPFPSIVVG